MTAEPLGGAAAGPVEVFTRRAGAIEREVTLSDGSKVSSHVRVATDTVAAIGSHDASAAAHEHAWLRGGRVQSPTNGQAISVVDLFSGCGGLTVGAEEAARALGRPVEIQMAVDLDESALSVYEQNFTPRELVAHPIELLVDRPFGQPLSFNEQSLRRKVGGVTVLLGGPPCQGHSSLNNHTRRDDPKNSLYLAMARFAEVVRPDCLLIENVPDVVHSRVDVVTQTMQALWALGYQVDSSVVRGVDLGLAQTRRRHVLVARRGLAKIDIAAMVKSHARGPRTASWALSGLSVTPGDTFNSTSEPSPRNLARMRYLLEHGVHDLPDSERPDCHRLKKHTYTSMYGRIHADRPAPTITSGFGSMGQGRFVHPNEARTLTPHEAARLQGFPDHFTFEAGRNRSCLARMIGNAVPPRLAYVPILEMLR